MCDNSYGMQSVKSCDVRGVNRSQLNTRCVKSQSEPFDISSTRRQSSFRNSLGMWLLFVLVTCSALFIIVPQATAQSDIPILISYTVQPHDTLWSYASRITPQGGDVYETMDLIKQINHMTSDNLIVGQTLFVPQA